MDFAQLFKAPAQVWEARQESPKVGAPPPPRTAAANANQGGDAGAAAALHPDHAPPVPGNAAELDDLRARIAAKKERLLQAQADGDQFQIEDIQASLAELEGKMGALGAPVAATAKVSVAPKPVEKPPESPEIEKNRATLAANQEGAGGENTMTPGQLAELEEHLHRYDHLPGGIQKAETELPGLDAAAEAANQAAIDKKRELAALLASAGDRPGDRQQQQLEAEVKEAEAQSDSALKARNDRWDEKVQLEQLLDESKRFVEQEQQGFDLSLPDKVEPGEPFDMGKHHVALAKEIGALEGEREGLPAKTDAEFAALSKQIDDPNTSDEQRLAARQQRELLESLEDRRRDELKKQEADLHADLRASYVLQQQVGKQTSFDDLVAGHSANDFTTRDEVERQIDALKTALGDDRGLKASLGDDHARLKEKYPDIAASFPRLGYGADQTRWLEQRLAYLARRADELPRKVQLDMRAAEERALVDPPKSEEELAAEQREQNLELVKAMSQPGATQDPAHYLLGLEKMKAAAATLESAPAQIDLQGKSVEELRGREADLTRRCAEAEKHLAWLEAARTAAHDPDEVQKLMAEHRAAQKELLAVSRKLAAGNQSLDELQLKLKNAEKELAGPAQFVDITDQRETVGVGSDRIEDTRAMLYDALEIDFGKEKVAESDRLFNKVLAEARPSASLFLDPTRTPRPTTVGEIDALLAEYHKRELIDRTLAQPAREKMQGADGQKKWLMKDGATEVTGDMFGPQFGLTDGQRAVIEEEVARLKAMRAQLDGSDAALAAKRDQAEAAENAEEQAAAAKFDERADIDLEGRYNLILGRLAEDAALKQSQMNGDDVLAHMNMTAQIAAMKQRLMELSGKIKRARRENQPVDELVAQRAQLLEDARQFQKEYVAKGDAMIARAGELGRDLPDELKAHLTAKGQADDRKGVEGLIKQLEQDQKLDGLAP